MKKKYIIVIALLLTALTTTSIVFAYYEHREKTRERVVKEQGSDKALVSIPDGITKVRIVDGSFGDVVTIDGDGIAEFFAGFEHVIGKVEYVEQGSGYRYGVHCYREDERVLSFTFMTETVIQEGLDDRIARLFTANEAIPAYTYIERLFAEFRSQK